nr:copia protein [Tanacetum cinerariifolium]
MTTSVLLVIKESNTRPPPVIAENKANITTGLKEANNSVAETLSKMFAQGIEDFLIQAGAARASGTNYVNTASTLVNNASTPVNTASTPVNTASIRVDTASTPVNIASPLRNIPSLEDIYVVPNDGIFTNASYDDDGQNKKDERGVVVRNKARLVSQGHGQEEGIDYDDIFAPVARIKAIGIFLAFASYMGFTVYYMDVKSTFLYGKIDEEVYVSQPPGFIDSNFLKKVYKVVKALYGLHQDPRAWYATLSTFLVQSGYRRGLIDKTLFIKKNKKDIMLVTLKTSHLYAVKRIFRYLKGQPKLGLWYPRESAFDLKAYSDSDYTGANIDRKSTTRGCQFLSRRLISWLCKKQTFVATLTTKAEYVAAASCCGQVLWIQNQMNHFIKDAYEKKLIQVLKIHTDENVVDLLTKAFDVNSLDKEHVSKQGRKKDKTGTNIKEGTNYVVNEGSYTDKVKVRNAKAEGISVAGEIINASTLKFVQNYLVINAPCYCNEALAIPEQTATGKETSNLFMAGRGGLLRIIDLHKLVLLHQLSVAVEVTTVRDPHKRMESDRDEIPDPNLTNVYQSKHEEKDIDERVHTPSDYELTDDEKIHNEENIYEEEEDVVTKELYDDVNINLENKDTKMTNADHDRYMDNKLGEAIYKDIQAHNLDCREVAHADKREYIKLVDLMVRTIIKEEINTQLPQILPQAFSDVATLIIEKNVTASLKAAVLTRSSYEAAATLSEFELTKILLDKMEKNKSCDIVDHKRELYDALVKSYNTDKDIFESYGDVFSLKRSRDERNKDRDPVSRSDRGTKRRKSSKDVESSRDLRSKEKKFSSTSKNVSKS